MEKSPSDPSNQTNQAPEPQTLVARTDDGTPQPGATPGTTPTLGGHAPIKSHKRRTYRPSHKATFIGLAVVVAILLVNAVVLSFVLKGKAKSNNLNTDQVTLSKSALGKIGVNKDTVGDTGELLVVGPNARFNGKVTVAGDVTLSGELKLNSKFSASDASLTQLEAGKASFSDLNVSGDGTLSKLNLRNGLVVTGATQLQGTLTVNQLVNVNSNLNVTGNVSVGGTFSAKTFSANSLTSTTTLTIGGHVITNGLAPGVSKGGSALGNNGTVGISGNDSSGVISINIGTGAGTGTLATVTFHSAYSGTPHVVITSVGAACTFYLGSLSNTGFSVADGCNLPPGGYALEYIVMQ